MIQIIDNFFDEDLFKKIKNYVTTQLHYTPRWFENAKEKDEMSFYGSRFILNNDLGLKKTFIKQSEDKFKIKIKKISDESGVDIRNLRYFKPHRDPCKLNILMMISGPEEFFNGTVFYGNKGTIEEGAKLDLHIGFKENRAVMYTSDYIHSPCASPNPEVRRFTASLFVTEYK